MNTEMHKKQIKWPVLITENTKTGKYAAILKGVDGVVAQGDSIENVMEELKISLEAMSEYYATCDDCDTITDESGEFEMFEQKELVLQLCD